jgi:GNAT superfamily N-acetyltransferase
MSKIRNVDVVPGAPVQAFVPSQKTANIMIKGRWHTSPALEFEDRLIAITGKWLRKAVVHGEARQESALRDPAAMVEFLRTQRGRLRADIFMFAQQLPLTDVQYNYPLTWDSVAAIWIKDFDSWWNALPPSTRKNIRRSERGGVVVETRQFDDELVKGIASINDASPVRQGRSNYHYGKPIEDVRREFGSYLDRSTFICAFADGQMIAFLKLVYQRDSASILNLAVKAVPYHKGLANAPAVCPENRYRGVARVLIAKAVELCAARGVACLRYGFYNYGNKQASSLREFKTLNGFVEVRVPRYYIPLTRWGTLCIRFNLHRGLFGVLPTRVIALVVGLRARWYAVKHLLRRKSGERLGDMPED